MQDRDGTPRLLYARVCRPAGDPPARAVVLNHGNGALYAAEQPLLCTHEAVEWFLRRGYAVMMPIRRGFGATGGKYSEGLAAGPHGVRSCEDQNPYLQALEGTRNVEAAVDYVTALPGVQPRDAVVLGVSTGGYASIAYSSVPHPKVGALINVSGGRGGRGGSTIAQVCHADRVIDGVRRFGETAQTPMLWVYATNDHVISPDLARQMHKAYTEAGGKAEFSQTGTFGFDGHALFLGWSGSLMWGPPVERYLARQFGGEH